MKYRWLVIAGVLVAIGALLSPWLLRPSAQASALAATASVGKMPTYTPTYSPPEPPSYSAPKTAWGDPDISGNFTNKYEQGTPMERAGSEPREPR